MKKCVDYGFILPTNIDDAYELDYKVSTHIADTICKNVKDVTKKMVSTLNGEVELTIHICSSAEETFNEFNDYFIDGYLICNDDVENTGVADSVYVEMQKILADVIDKINALKIEIPDGVFKITRSDLDIDWLDGSIDDIRDYTE